MCSEVGDRWIDPAGVLTGSALAAWTRVGGFVDQDRIHGCRVGDLLQSQLREGGWNLVGITDPQEKYIGVRPLMRSIYACVAMPVGIAVRSL